MVLYMNEKMNAILFPCYEGCEGTILQTLAESYSGTETLEWMRLFGDRVQPNQVCTFRSVVSYLTWASRVGLRGVIDLLVHCL